MKRRALIFAAGAASGGMLGASAQWAFAPARPSDRAASVIVATVAALKSLVDRPPVVMTQGYRQANDGGGGPLWIWVAGSTAIADDFLAVQPIRGPGGRYLRLIEHGVPVSPKWGGAGLGAADDTIRFQTVISAGGAHAVDLSGCTIPVTQVRIDENVTCPGIFSNGGGVITCAEGTTHRTFLLTVHKSDFYVDRIFFDAPISKAPGSPPACGTILSFEGRGSQTDRQRVTNCRFRGGSTACQFRNAASNAFGYFTDNVVTDTWAVATVVHVPRNFMFTRNQVADCGYDPAQTDSACHFTTYFSPEPAENLIVTQNVIRDCCVGFNQEAIDLAGGLIRNAVFANNILDRVTYGGFEFKSIGMATASDDFYGDVLIEGNIVNFIPRGIGIGIALNSNGTPEHKFRRFKIAGNQFVCDASGSDSAGINVSSYDDVDISGNQFNNIAVAVMVHPNGYPSQSAYNVVIQGNSINVSHHGIRCAGKLISRLAVQGNHVIAGQEAFQCNNAAIVKLVCIGNHFETTAALGKSVELRNIQTGRFVGNTLLGTDVGMKIGGVPSTNLRVVGNDVTAAVGDAFVVDTGNAVVISDNTCTIAPSNRIVSGAGTYATVNNSRGVAAANPTGTLAGSIGDIVWNTLPIGGGLRGWICTTAGQIGTAIYKGLPIQP